MMRKLFRAVDADNSGLLDFFEFVCFIIGVANHLNYKSVLKNSHDTAGVKRGLLRIVQVCAVPRCPQIALANASPPQIRALEIA